MSLRWFDEVTLIDRLVYAATKNRKHVVFLVGAPLSAPEGEGRLGVPNVNQLIDIIRSELSDQPGALMRLEQEIQTGNRYQKAFEYLIGARGQDAANSVVRRAVLSARAERPNFLQDQTLNDGKCEELEQDIEGWVLPTAVRTLGKILVEHPKTFGRTVLTSNFDPLIEISIRKSGGAYYRTVLHSDGDLGQTTGQGTHVVHLHGYWVGRDTLHTPRQLQQNRPRLRRSLAHLLEDRLVVVLGYGGWDDVFTKTLVEVALDDASHPELIWTFFGRDPSIIETERSETLTLLSPALNRGRVTLVAGIDCHNLLPRLRESLSDEGAKTALRLESQSSLGRVEIENRDDGEGGFEVRISLSKTELNSAPDNPPETSIWVGREHELALLENKSASIFVITGIGGQGKSTLAAYYLRRQNEKQSFELWDWRDCREEGDRIHTQVTAVIERLARGEVFTSELESKNLEAILDSFFLHLGNRRCLFVFDNVDHYVDLTTGQPTAGLKKLVNAIQKNNRSSLFIFTCRPPLLHDDPNVIAIPLEGLSQDEARQLFEKRELPKSDYALIPDAHALTTGHPLWLSIIAVQAGRTKGGLAEVLTAINKGQGGLPENTLRSIWDTLNENQRSMLRTMAELERPETEDRLVQMISIPWNRYSKAMRTLKSLSLVVVKPGHDGPDLLDLHPLIRKFVRSNFQRSEREKFISAILSFFDRMIGQYKGTLGQRPSFDVLGHWIQKAELELNRGHHEAAVATIYEVSASLLERGFPEEFLRIGKRMLREIDWAEACASFKQFDDLIDKLTCTQIQFGDFEEAKRVIDKYEKSIPGKSAAYINLCDLRCYYYWYQGHHEEAIYWGEQGERLEKNSNVDTRFSTKHNLALAYRDSGQLDKALEFFLKGKPLEDVIEGKIKEHGAYYGNIGRCLQFKGDLDNALKVLRKSADIIEVESGSEKMLNQGYCRLWIGEILAKQDQWALAAAFFRAAQEIWRMVSPPRARSIEAKLAECLSADPGLVAVRRDHEWEPEAQVLRWIHGEKSE